MVLCFPVTVALLCWAAGNLLRLPLCSKDWRSELGSTQLRKLPVSRVDSVLVWPSLAYLWESGRDPELSSGYGRM